MTKSARHAALAAALLLTATPLTAQRGPGLTQSGVPAEVLSLACAPFAVVGRPSVPLKITGGQDSFTRRNYQLGDLITINAGTAGGIKVGDEFFVRRTQIPREDKPRVDSPVVVRTAGWVRIWSVDETMALATITHACDTIEVGDYLEPLALPVPPVPQADKPRAERDHYTTIMQGTDLRRSFGPGDYFIIARGSTEGVVPGAQFVIYRDKHEAKNFLFELGEAVAVNVGPTLSTLQVTLARDAISEGDLIAQRR